MNNNKFLEIDTGNGIDRNLAATTNNRLELLIEDIRSLNETTKESNKENKNLQNKMLYLTYVGVGIAIIQLILIFT